MKDIAIFAVVLLSLIGSATMSYAVPITYDFYGKMSGYGKPLEGKEIYFKEADFVFSFSSDTDKIGEKKYDEDHSSYYAFLTSGYLTVDGIGFFDMDNDSNMVALYQPYNEIKLYLEGFELGLFSEALHQYDLGSALTTSPTKSYVYPFKFSKGKGETFVAVEDAYLTGFSAEVAPVPEPSTLLLLAGGITGLFFYRRKKT